MTSNEANYNEATDDDGFWLKAGERSLNAIWDNCDDDVYAELLETSMTKRGETDEYLRTNN